MKNTNRVRLNGGKTSRSKQAENAAKANAALEPDLLAISSHLNHKERKKMAEKFASFAAQLFRSAHLMSRNLNAEKKRPVVIEGYIPNANDIAELREIVRGFSILDYLDFIARMRTDIQFLERMMEALCTSLPCQQTIEIHLN